MSFYTTKMTLLKNLFFITVICFITLFTTTILFAQSSTFLIPPAEFKAFDTPNDAGETISLTWSASPNDSPYVFYVVYIDRDKNGT
ncbi:MAG: hypothetical protein AAB013_07115, partial [Planctomycetota bacterium]